MQSKTWVRIKMFLVGIFFIASGIGLFGYVNSTTVMDNLSGKTASFSREGVIDSLKEIQQETEDQNLLGSTVLLRDVSVAEVIGNYTFIVGRAKEALPVVMLGELAKRQPDEMVDVRPQQKVRVMGYLFALKDLEMLIDPQWMDAQSLKKLKSYNKFIFALRVSVKED